MSFPKRILRLGRHQETEGRSRTARGQNVAAGLNFRALRLAYRRAAQKSAGSAGILPAVFFNRRQRSAGARNRLITMSLAKQFCVLRPPYSADTMCAMASSNVTF